MRKVLVIGAFDRYNYGDNLMPILFEMLLQKRHPQVLNKFEFTYASLTKSDLSQYGAKSTESLASAMRGEGLHAIISVGGEVLCASSSALFLHMDHPEIFLNLITFLRRVRLRPVADFLCRTYYRLPWEYPYIPDPSRIPGALVGFNTVGGGLPGRALKPGIYNAKERILAAAYVSVRDSRTKRALQSFRNPQVFPDSAVIMSDLADDDFLRTRSSTRVMSLLPPKYLVFQCAPHKVGASVDSVVACLASLREDLGCEVVLCPIGYAKGHQDRDFLASVNSAARGKFVYLDELNIWEIMYVISKASLFIGTSLHGVITALSYAVPHLGINDEVLKLDSFLGDWSIPPLNRCYSISELRRVALDAISVPKERLVHHASLLKKLALINNDQMIESLDLIS